jgi:Fic family protein
MKDFFTYNPLWHDKIGKIYALLERVKISEEQSKDVLRLRRTNRILSVGSTTAIEGNRLTVQQVFEWMPVETMIYHNQQKYYDALQQSHKNSVDCSPFIDFMIDVIENSMYQYCENASVNAQNGGVNVIQQEIIALVRENPNIRAFEMAQRLLKPVRTIENNLRQLKDKGVITRVGSKKRVIGK